MDPTGTRRLTIGQIVDRYTVEALIGEGGMASVYRVRHSALGTLHALKLPHRPSEELHRRLLEEGRIQARLRHPNLVPVTDVISVESAPALVMALVAGPTLAAALRDLTLPLEEAERLFRGVLAGVAYAHAHGVVHRDLKPSNVLLATDEGGVVPRVVDFGVARLIQQVVGEHTPTGHVLGTPAYMAPEQVYAPKTVDHRADLFSLGVLLYELVCGRRPFESEDVLALAAAMTARDYLAPELLCPELPARLVEAIRVCLEPDPARRVGSASELLTLLGEAPPARPEADRPWVLRMAPPRRAISVGLIAASLLAITAAGWGLVQRRARQNAEGTAAMAMARAEWRDLEAAGLRQAEAARPGEALALLRAAAASAAASGDDPDQVLSLDREMALRLSGAASHVIPTGNEVLSVVARAGPGLVAAGLEGDGLLVLNVDTGQTKHRIATALGRITWMEPLGDGAQVIAWTDPRDYAPEGYAAPGIWDLSTGQLVRALRHPFASLVQTISVTPDGHTALTATQEGELRRWDLITGDSTVVESARLRSVTLSPDGALIAGSVDRRPVLLAQDGRQRPLGGTIVSDRMGFSPDGRWLVALSRAVTLWETRTWRPRVYTEVAADRDALFSPDSSRLLVWDGNAAPVLFDLAVGAVIGRLSGHSHAVGKAAFSPDGRLIATGAQDGVVRTFAAADARPMSTLLGHNNYVHTVDVLPDGRVVSGGLDSTVRVWAEVTGPPGLLFAHEKVANPIVSRGGEAIAWGGRDRRLGVSPLLADSANDSLDGVGPVIEKRWMGSTLILRTEQALMSWRLGEGVIWAIGAIPIGIRHAAASPDGARVVIAGWGWSLLDGKTGALLRGQPGGQVFSFAGNPDLTQIATGAIDAPAEVWDLLNGARRFACNGPSGVASLAWSSDGRRIAVGDWEGDVWVWDAATGATVVRWSGHSDAVISLAWSPDSQTLASASWDDSVRLWDGETGAVRLLPQHRADVESLAWSPDSRWIAAGAKDGRVRLWEASTGAQAALYLGHTGAIRQLEFSQDGKRLVSAGRDDAVRVWAVPERLEPSLLRTGAMTNYRVCPGTDEVVAVVPYPKPETVWAEGCESGGEPGVMTDR